MYFDTAYISKFYFNESDSERVRELVRTANVIYSSIWALAEFHSVLHRRLREGTASRDDIRDLSLQFAEHVRIGLWNLVPLTEALLRRTSAALLSAPGELFLRTADAVHLMTAQDLGEQQVWTNDRHMLKAAVQFGLEGCSV